uniref:Virion structural protein n=1 Tax=Pseudomonas phage RVTF4 TaxID=3236931 RepID=A0AB39CCT3_9VIRU
MGTNSVKMNSDYSGGQAFAQRRYITSVRDERIRDLMLEYTTFPTRTTQWEFRRRVIAEAKRLFGGNYNWFIMQDTNAQRVDWNYKFLLDTIRFIATGRRELDIHSWPMMLTDEPPTGLQLIGARSDIGDLFKKLALQTSTEAMIQKWLTQKNGFDDMMYTLNMLFGKATVKVK